MFALQRDVNLCVKCLQLLVRSRRSLSRVSTSTNLYSVHKGLQRQFHINAKSLTTTSSCFSGKEEEDVKLNIEENPYFDKYRGKIQDLQRCAPEMYGKKVSQIEEEMRKDRAFIREQLEKAEAEAKAKAKTGAEGKGFPPDSLDSIMKTELVKDKTAEEIEEIWKEYHKKKDCVFAVLRAIDYEDIEERAKTCPSFLYPLPRKDGYEFIFAMISGKSVYFTPLIMYQRLKDSAPPCLTLSHFTEFKDDKDIVLMTGQYDDSILSRTEAVNLVRQMSLYYSRRSAERFNLVRIFNHTPDKFNPLDVVNEYQEMIKFLESA